MLKTPRPSVRRSNITNLYGRAAQPGLPRTQSTCLRQEHIGWNRDPSSWAKTSKAYTARRAKGSISFLKVSGFGPIMHGDEAEDVNVVTKRRATAVYTC